jgi:hypothetical protein
MRNLSANALATSISFTKFQAEKYDFDLYKWLFTAKMAQIRQIWNFKKFKSPEPYDSFQKVAKNIEGFCSFSIFMCIK